MSNTSGRPPLPPPPPRRANPPRAPPRPTSPVSEDFWSSSSVFSSSDREDTPWPDTEDLSDFVDLTADSSPPNMPPAASHRRQPPSRMSRDTSSAPSNPAKRRKIEASHSSSRALKIDEVDLRVRKNERSKKLYCACITGILPACSAIPFYNLHC